MSFWIEYDDHGGVLAAYSGAGEQHPLRGGVLIEVDRKYDPNQTMVLDGEVVDFGFRPSQIHTMDPTTRAWVSLGKTELELAQDAKWLQIKRKRDELEAGGFPYLGKVVDSDKLSVQRIALAVQSAQAAISAGAAFEIEWTCADNSTIQLDGPAMAGMPVALAEHANSLHVIARELRASIYAEDATEESVAAISWPS